MDLSHVDVFELRSNFKKILEKLDCGSPKTEEEALGVLLRSNMLKIISSGNPQKSLREMINLIREVNYDIIGNSDEYAGDSLGIEKLYGIDDTYYEIEGGEYAVTESQLEELKKETIEEAQRWLTRFELRAL